MRNLRLYYETDTQIFVHAGVDEDIPEEEIQWCTLGTPDYVMTGKYPPSIGHFYKDIIAGHVAASHLARDFRFRDIFYDGESHYYIDGSAAKFGRILCLAYDEKPEKYYQLEALIRPQYAQGALKGLLHHCRRKVVLQQALAQVGRGALANRGPSEDLLVRVSGRLSLLVAQSALPLFPARGTYEILRARCPCIPAADGVVLGRARPSGDLRARLL